jgi:hypothetical protein
MPPETAATPDAPQPAVEPSSPAVEVPTETPPSEPMQVAPESASASAEAALAPETGPQGPLPFSTTADRQENQVAQTPPPTAQIPPNEPIEPEPEPIETPEPPSAAASAPAPVIVQTGILHSAREFLGKARVAIQDRKRKKRDKIMQALTTKTKITNDEVEKLLHVSDATATRYLSALEKENRIKQVGKTGHGVVYSKI